MIKRSFFGSAGWVLLLGALAGAQTVIRVGAFPNITHPQAMVGKNNGWFEKAMGPQNKIDWKSFNAGPSAIEALFAGAIDMTYIGPLPATFASTEKLCGLWRVRLVGERRWWCAAMPAFRSRRIFTARRSLRRRWATRRTSRCAHG